MIDHIYFKEVLQVSNDLTCKSAQIVDCAWFWMVQGLKDWGLDTSPRRLRTQEEAGHTRSTHLTSVGPSKSHPELEWPWLQGPEECFGSVSTAALGSTISKHYGMSALCI